MELSEQRKTQFNDLTHRTQVEQSGPMGLEAHDLGAVGVQIEETAPGIRKYRCTVIAGGIPKEIKHAFKETSSSRKL